jgi:beta-1,4-mannosyltransferase
MVDEPRPAYMDWTLDRYQQAVQKLLRLHRAYFVALVLATVIVASFYWTADYWTASTNIWWHTSPDYWWIPFAWMASVPMMIVAGWGYFTGLPRTLNFRPASPVSFKRSDVVFAITTLGTEPRTVLNTARSVLYWTGRHAELSYRTHVVVVVEEKGYLRNREVFDAMRDEKIEVHVVPPDLVTPNGSMRKARALWYGAQLRREKFLDLTKVWVYHHDDETALGEDAILGIEEFTRAYADERAIGYGVILYDQYFSWRPAQVQELTRTASDLSNLTFVGRHNNPMGMYHGSHYVVRADLEDDFGWDIGMGNNGAYISEDLMFDVGTRELGANFEPLHGFAHEMAPMSIGDQLRQRRRWIQEAFAVYARGLSPASRTVVASYNYGLWFIGGLTPVLLIASLYAGVGSLITASFVGFIWASMLSGYHRAWMLHKVYVDRTWTTTAVTKGLMGAVVDGFAPWFAVLSKKRKSFDIVSKDRP